MKNMKEDDFTLSTGKQVQLIYLQKQEVAKGPLAYLHHIRNPRTLKILGEDGIEHTYGIPYQKSLHSFTKEYENWSKEHPIELIVSPPSSRQDARPYREAILEQQAGPLDITRHFNKSTSVKSIHPATTLNDLIAAITHYALPDLGGYRGVLIVDELFSSGNTIAAMLHHLCSAGLSIDAEVLVCAPLWLSGRKG